MKSVNRRRFLARVSGGLAGLSAGLAVARSLSWTLRLSASSIAFSRLPIEQACERIARLGFEGIDIWSAYAGCPHFDDIQRRLGFEGLKLHPRCELMRPPAQLASGLTSAVGSTKLVFETIDLSVKARLRCSASG